MIAKSMKSTDFANFMVFTDFDMDFCRFQCGFCGFQCSFAEFNADFVDFTDFGLKLVKLTISFIPQ